MTVQQDKSRLREVFKKKRSALSSSEVTKKSQAINWNFIKNLLPKIYQKNSRKIFSLYLQAKNEVGTGVLADYFEQHRIPFSYPKISGNRGILEFILAQPDQTFLPNDCYQSVFEPSSGQKVAPDFLIMPLLAFDRDFSRLGMGGGFFDRTITELKKRNSKIITIGLAYEFQRAEGMLPVENTDRKLDVIVTEKNLFVSSHVS